VRPHPETRGTGPRILGIQSRNDSATPAVPGEDIEWPGDLAVILLDARLVARWDAFSDRCAAEWPRRSGLGTGGDTGQRCRRSPIDDRPPDRIPTREVLSSVQPAPDADNQPAFPLARAYVEPPAGIEPATPSLPFVLSRSYIEVAQVKVTRVTLSDR
jgi:hypothetical protein